MSRLVLDVVDDSLPPSILGIHTSIDDVALVYALNQELDWGLCRFPEWKCIQPHLYSYHAFYRTHWQNVTISLLWNVPEETTWINTPPTKEADLFSNEEPMLPPKRPLINHPGSPNAFLVFDPELSPQEMVILQRQIASVRGVVQQRFLPWSTLRERENFLFEPLNDD